MDMTVTLTKRGNDIVSADIEMSCDVAEGSTRAVITMTEHAAPDKVTVDVAMSVEDEAMGMTLKLNLTGEWQQAPDRPGQGPVFHDVPFTPGQTGWNWWAFSSPLRMRRAPRARASISFSPGMTTTRHKLCR